ncbi:MAG: NrfD/PsrC family molybdoenzyme membrane anchor subunit [Candidatus Acidiferrum sp.]
MKSPAKPKATEERLDEIRKAAGESGKPAGLPASVEDQNAQKGESYYGLPVLKVPVWTWEVPLYFFMGGIAGVSACIGFAAYLFHAQPALIRVALWVGLIGAAICPVLLISDLGRPARFLNMLRVFKLQSAMSLGAWILVAFSSCVLLAVVCFELILRGFASPFTISFFWIGAACGAMTGLLLASYTGVLIAATAIPVWSENRILLPIHFLTSGLGGASGILELAGFLIPATQILGLVSSGIETVIGILLEVRKKPVDAPLYHGKSGSLLRIAGVMEGPVALTLRIFVGSAPAGRYAAAGCFLIGALLSRYAWIWAGRVSADDPHALFDLQRKRKG